MTLGFIFGILEYNSDLNFVNIFNLSSSDCIADK